MNPRRTGTRTTGRAAARQQQATGGERAGAPGHLPRWAAAILIAAVLAAAGTYAFLRHHGQAAAGQVVASDHGVPVYQVVEGQRGYPYPYDPRVLHVHAGHPFAIRLTDNLGGCGLDTVFPGLGQNGGTATVNVPVGSTRTLTLEAARPGRYAFHCGSDMYFGTIVAT